MFAYFTVASAKPAQAEGPFPARCVVEGTVATDGDGAGPNSARLRVQLPENWNGKLVFFGVGGLAGSLDPSASPHDFVSALGLGYATAITDTGHVGKSPFDADWILEAPGKPNEAKIVDYFYRAPHQATVVAKALAAAFYGAPKVSRAYFDGCSFGGHMGLMEAMRYPDDYDGVIAGAPYMDNHTQLWGYKNAKAFLKAYVTPDVVTKVNEAVLAACDAEDGVKDGLIQKSRANAASIRNRSCPRRSPRRRPTPSRHSCAPVTDAQRFPRFIQAHRLQSSPRPMARPRLRRLGRHPAALADPAAAEPWGAKPPVLWAAAEGFTKSIDLHDPAFDFNNNWPETNGQSPMTR